MTEAHRHASGARPAGPRDTRRHNLSLVLREVLVAQESSRANVAEATGLTKATVSSLVTELIESGLLVEGGQDITGRIGRPGLMLSLNGDSVAGVGLEINVDYIAVCVLDLLGRVRHRRVVRIDNRLSAPEEVINAVARLGRQAIGKAEQQGMLPGGVTVAVPGLVELAEGMLLIAPNLGWERMPLASILADRMRRPELRVRVENEANLGALGELWEGRGIDWGDFCHISGEIGVGLGIVVGGALLRGSGGLAGEFGHIQVDPNGPPCPCGARGCLERVVGQEALLAAAGIAAELATSTGDPKDGGAAALVAQARAGDSRTLMALREAGNVLGAACGALVNLLNPATVVLGGIFAPLAPWLLAPFQDTVRRSSIATRCRAPLRIEVSELGPEAAVRGAASSALRDILADPYLMPRTSPRRAI